MSEANDALSVNSGVQAPGNVTTVVRERKDVSYDAMPEVFRCKLDKRVSPNPLAVVQSAEAETKDVQLPFVGGLDKRVEIQKLLNSSKIVPIRSPHHEIPPTGKINQREKPNLEPIMQKSDQQPPKKKQRLLLLLDLTTSMVLIAPLVVGYWRGVWNLMDLRMDIFPGWFVFVAGCLGHMIFAMAQYLLHEGIVQPLRTDTMARRITAKFTQISYTYLFGVVCNLHWRGAWIFFDQWFGTTVWLVLTGCFVSLVGLAILLSVRNLIASPVQVIVDHPDYTFLFPTRYKTNTRDWSLYLLDCAFSVGVVGTLVVFVWRGVWILFDIYLYPENREYSAIGSLAIGYAIVAVSFCLQPLMRYVCARLQGLARLIVADGFLLLSFLGTVNVWRGIWNVLDLWLLPDNPVLSCWITHVGCFVFLVLLNCSNSILVRGVYIDAEEDEGKCVEFPCHYLRLFFKIEREKKEARRRNLLVASKDFRPRADGNAKDTENGALLQNSTAATILPANPESLV